MARKDNSSPLDIDFTSYTFTRMCSVCHPGGGPAEYDRNGNRYDAFAADPKNGIVSGGANHLDGDYFKAKWAESGVIEADCLICHLKDYDMAKRNAQVKAFNFRWAATAGGGFGDVEGSVMEGGTPKVAYNPSMFQKDGKVILPVIKEVQNENCLFCHYGSDWKKRGSSYNYRTDVHIRAGLRCIDCHLTGRHAEDSRISGKEAHQIGKGDDPGDFVRDDLDNTMRSCDDCHMKGILNAPIPQHKAIPPLHFERISCQTCHIPWRQVKATLVQDASVFNAGPRIAPPAKRIWNFYGPDVKPWNFYGFELGYPEGSQPFFKFRPALGRYKDKIYPLNRVYTLWIGIKKDGEKGINQPYMKDVFMMWKKHLADPDRVFPELSVINDDNRDGFPEVNRPVEIKALLAAVTTMLKQKGLSMKDRMPVFVDGDRYTTDGNAWTDIPKKPYEYSPYGSVFKHSHDITPAKNALGAKGCADCHSPTSDFFFRPVMQRPFDASGKPAYVPQYKIMGFDGQARRYSGVAGTTASFFRWLTIIILAGLFIHMSLDFFARRREIKKAKKEGASLKTAHLPEDEYQRFNPNFLAQHLLLAAGVILLSLSGIFLWGLRYPGAHWAAVLTSVCGGIDFWRLVHRGGALLLVFDCIYHLVYSMVHPEGRRDFILMLPRLKDLREFGQNLLWFVGLRDNRPAFGRFTYFEKFDYWAVFWGCVIMVVSGLIMWFPHVAEMLLPGITPAAFDAFKEAHAHEALLAVLAIFIWHFYNAQFRPGRFPGSLSWMHGRVRRREMVREHLLEMDVD